MTEQNRPTLKEALSKLPVYGPPAGGWKSIDRELSIKRQEKPLHQAVAGLPEHAPSPHNWKNIEAILNADASEAALQQALAELPQYTPPGKVWEGVSENINRPAQRFRLTALARMAAAIALLLGLWWAWPAPSGSEPMSETYAYAQERITGAFTPEADWEEDHQLMQIAVQAFRKDPVAQQLPEYEVLLDEWAALKAAQEEVAAMMERYGKDNQLVRQMSKIERERTGLIREMIAQI